MDSNWIKRDSRVFTTPRLQSFAGYERDPFMDSSLEFELPVFQQLWGRLVRPNYHLWSPNSDLDAFFPGLPPVEYSELDPSDP
ncbi:hypothetical protein DXG01_014980, partial [Tephrocybe rancida]